MTDTMTVTSILTMISDLQSEAPRYYVRAIRASGEEPTMVGGWGTEVFFLDTEKFANAEDIEERLLPSVRAENDKFPHDPIVRLESYIKRVVEVASIDLDVKTSTEASGAWAFNG